MSADTTSAAQGDYTPHWEFFRLERAPGDRLVRVEPGRRVEYVALRAERASDIRDILVACRGIWFTGPLLDKIEVVIGKLGKML